LETAFKTSTVISFSIILHNHQWPTTSTSDRTSFIHIGHLILETVDHQAKEQSGATLL
jgi:hypothetical protein